MLAVVYNWLKGTGLKKKKKKNLKIWHLIVLQLIRKMFPNSLWGCPGYRTEYFPMSLSWDLLQVSVICWLIKDLWLCPSALSNGNFFFKFIYLFIHSFMAVLGLRFCARALSSCGKRGPLFIAVRGPLTITASLVAEHRLQTRRLSNCGSRA